MQSLTLHITGMSCGHCLNAVNAALGQLDGVVRRSRRASGGRSVEFDPAEVHPGRIAAAVAEAGYVPSQLAAIA